MRYIIGLRSAESRRHLTFSTLLQMSEEQQEHFANTVERISGNLEVQRNARDAEIHAKVVEIKAHIEAYHRGYGRGGEGDFSQL